MKRFVIGFKPNADTPNDWQYRQYLCWGGRFCVGMGYVWVRGPDQGWKKKHGSQAGFASKTLSSWLVPTMFIYPPMWRELRPGD